MLLPNVLSSSLEVLSSVFSILLLGPPSQVLVSVILFFSSKISIGVFFVSSISLLRLHRLQAPRRPPVVRPLVFNICVASPTFYRGSLVPPVAYGGRDAVSCLRLGHEGLWLLSWAFSLFRSHAQTLRSLALAEASCPAVRWHLRLCSVTYQKTQDKLDKLGSSDSFTWKLLLPHLLPRVTSLT